MTRTEDSNPQPVTDPATAALVRIVGILAIICLCAVGYLMVKKSQDDSALRARCIVYETRIDKSAYVPLECR